VSIITRIRPYVRPAWWQCHCYFDYARNERVMAPIGLHLVIRAWWGFCLRYWLWSWGPCFLDDRVREALDTKLENYNLRWKLDLEKKRVAALLQDLAKEIERRTK